MEAVDFLLSGHLKYAIPKHPADAPPGGAPGGASGSLPTNTSQPKPAGGSAVERTPAPIPQKTPGWEHPVFEYPGGVDTIGAGVRSIARGLTPGVPQFEGQEGAKFMTPQVAQMLNQFAVPWIFNQVRPVRPQQLGNDPFGAHQMTQRMPQQYRNAGAAAQHALRTYNPYQNGFTQGAEMLNQFMQNPQGLMMDPEVLDRMNGVMQGMIR